MMNSINSDPIYSLTSLIWIFGGGLTILLEVFQRPVMRFLRMRPASELYTLPRLKRSARINEAIMRPTVILLGAAFILQGLGPHFLAVETVNMLFMTLMGLVGLGILVSLAVTLAHWKA
jgi:hypothetical protein